MRIIEDAIKLDPLSPILNHALGNVYTYAGRFDDGIRQADKVLEMHPQMRTCIDLKGWSYVMKGEFEKALKLFEEVHQLTNHPLKALMGLGYCYAKLGYPKKPWNDIRKTVQRQVEEPEAVVDGDLIGLWLSLRNIDKVFYHIHKCVEKRIVPINMFLEYPVFEELKKDPRYQELKLMAAV